MNRDLLSNILSKKRERLKQRSSRPLSGSVFEKNHQGSRANTFRDALSCRDKVNVIAEFKRASPSKGVINESLDPASVARMYENGGACAISVLTEEDYFRGSLDDLRAVRAAVDLPILRKDFIIDEYQIPESAAAGADAILLIVAALTSENLLRFQKLAHDIGLVAVVEVHDRDELEIAKSIGAKIIGVNNRDLRTFEVSLDVSRYLIKNAPTGAIMVSESGLKSRGDLLELRNMGYSAFLIGETLMRSGDPKKELRELATEHTESTEELTV